MVPIALGAGGVFVFVSLFVNKKNKNSKVWLD